MNRIPKTLRNVGESLGLEYPYICRNLWLVWDRHTGKIVHVEFSGHPAHDAAACRKRCEELNGAGPHDPAMNVLHDMEP